MAQVTGGKKMDLPKQASTDSTQKTTKNPLEDLMKQSHDSTVRSFVSGKIYKMTGLLAGKTDSLTFETFAFTDVKALAQNDLLLLSQLFSDSTNFPKSGFKMLCAFAPNIGLELTNFDGKTEKYLVAYDCYKLAQLTNKGEIDQIRFAVDKMPLLRRLGYTTFLPPIQTMGTQKAGLKFNNLANPSNTNEKHTEKKMSGEKAHKCKMY